MTLDIELRDEGIEPQIDVVFLEPRGVVHAELFGRTGTLPEQRPKKQWALVGHGDFVADEHDRPLLIVFANPFACTDSTGARPDNKVVSTNHLPARITANR